MSPSLYPVHCRERSAESCCSSHATPASPSGRTGFSSRGSRHVLECSSAHWGPCRPSRAPGMTPAAGLAQRIGDSTSLRLLYLSNMLFRPECSSRGEPHSPLYATSRRQRRQTLASRSLSSTLPSLPGMRDPKSWKQSRSRSDANQCVQRTRKSLFSMDAGASRLDRLFLLIHSASAPGPRQPNNSNYPGMR